MFLNFSENIKLNIRFIVIRDTTETKINLIKKGFILFFGIFNYIIKDIKKKGTNALKNNLKFVFSKIAQFY